MLLNGGDRFMLNLVQLYRTYGRGICYFSEVWSSMAWCRVTTVYYDMDIEWTPHDVSYKISYKISRYTLTHIHT